MNMIRHDHEVYDFSEGKMIRNIFEAMMGKFAKLVSMHFSVFDIAK